MRSVRFTKLSGTGNDFILIDNRRSVIRRRASFARRVCDRHEGVGGDGLLLLESSRRYAYVMRYYNADGTDGGMCGNGGRCMAWYAFTRRIAPARHVFEALGSPYEARILSSGRVRLAFPDPGPLIRTWEPAGERARRYRISCIDTGSPHAVIRVPRGTLDRCPVDELGKIIRHDRSFAPAGTNVNFIERVDGSRITLRTYERGVEAETLACGTGSIASAIVAARLWRVSSPVFVQAKGGLLKVTFDTMENRVTHVTLEGRVRETFGGSIDA